jgi:hypothetical protein
MVLVDISNIFFWIDWDLCGDMRGLMGRYADCLEICGLLGFMLLNGLLGLYGIELIDWLVWY